MTFQPNSYHSAQNPPISGQESVGEGKVLVRNTQSQILLHAQCYQRAWKALKSIGTPEDLEVYQKLNEKDLVVVKDITMVKRFGQGSDTLAWFW